jgi:hypothetical protein
MSMRHVACPGTIVLIDTEYAMLYALSYPAHVVDRENWCDLEKDHPGLHYVLGQESFDEAWWLRWNDEGDRRELTHSPAAQPKIPARTLNGVACRLVTGC